MPFRRPLKHTWLVSWRTPLSAPSTPRDKPCTKQTWCLPSASAVTKTMTSSIGSRKLEMRYSGSCRTEMKKNKCSSSALRSRTCTITESVTILWYLQLFLMASLENTSDYMEKLCFNYFCLKFKFSRKIQPLSQTI